MCHECYAVGNVFTQSNFLLFLVQLWRIYLNSDFSTIKLLDKLQKFHRVQQSIKQQNKDR